MTRFAVLLIIIGMLGLTFIVGISVGIVTTANLISEEANECHNDVS